MAIQQSRQFVDIFSSGSDFKIVFCNKMLAAYSLLILSVRRKCLPEGHMQIVSVSEE